MKSFIIFFSFIALITYQSYAQTGRQVVGTVQDSTGATLPGTLVKLISVSDSLNTATDANGVFSFGSVKAKQFSLTFRSLGFEGLKKKYALDDDTKPANLGAIKLHTESKMLNAVNITDVNAIKVKEDTTEYKASAYPVRANAPVEDVLKKLPGVDVDKDGNVTAEGKAVNKVRVNGKDFFGGDVKTATKNLPADMIESIQMIDDYGDQANLTGIKTGEPNKVMNIVIRQDKNYGYSFSGTGGDGGDAVPAPAALDNRYLGSINSFKFKGDQQIALLGSINNTNVNTFSFGGGNNGGGGGGRRGGGTTTPTNGITLAKSIGLNFRDQWGKKLSVYGSYSFADNTTNTTSTTSQTNPSFINNAIGNTTDGSINHRLNWNIEWKPDTVNYFKFMPSFSYGSTTNNDFDTNANILTNPVTNKRDTTAYHTTTIGNSNSPNYGAELLYNHRFNGHGRNLSIDLNASSTPSDQFSNPINVYTKGKPTSPVPTDQLINTHTRSNTIGTNFSYIEPISKVSYLEANYVLNRSNTTTNKETDTALYVNNATDYNHIYPYGRLSNDYNFTFTTNRFGLNYRLIKPKYNLTLGTGVQSAVLNGYSSATSIFAPVSTNVTTFNFIPTARFVYNFSRSQALSVNYNGSNSQPTYAELNPRPDSSNATYLVQGNPNLKPEFNNNFSIRYNKFSFGTGNILFTNLSFTQTNDKIVTNVISNVVISADKKRRSITQTATYLNSNGYYSTNGFFTFAKPWEKRKYTLIFNGNINYTNTPGFNTDTLGVTIKNIAKILSASPGLRFRFDIPDVIDVQASSSYSISQTINSDPNLLNTTFKTINLGLNGKNYLWTNWTVSYDYTKTIYQGYQNSTNPNIFNAYLERRFLKNNMATIRASAFDIFNENTGFTNSATANSTTQSLVNRLGRYYLLTLTVRLQKFAGKSPQQDMGPGGRRFGNDGGGGGRGPGGGGPGGF